MKNYKNLVPIGLVVFMGVGIYSVFANAATENSDYHAYLKKARKDAKLEVIEEAVQYYGKALEFNGENLLYQNILKNQPDMNSF